MTATMDEQASGRDMSQIEDLERQLAAEREARLRAEAVCAEMGRLLRRAVSVLEHREPGVYCYQVADIRAKASALVWSRDAGLELLADARALAEALWQAQWTFDGGAFSCAICNREDYEGHTDGCIVGRALVRAEKRGWLDPDALLAKKRGDGGERARWTDLSDLVARSEYGA